MNCKSGDLVKITGSSDRHLFKIGETVRLKEYLGGMNRAWKAEYLDGHDWWYVCESDMAPVKPATMPQKIIVTTDGKTTLARLFDGKTMVKRAEAKCALSDVFDFGIGAELAVKRLIGAKPVTEPIKESEPVKLYCVESWMPGSWITKGKIYEIGSSGRIRFDDGYSPTWKSLAKPSMQTKSLFPLVRRPAKVGEWVYVIDSTNEDVYRKNDVCEVVAENRGIRGKIDGVYIRTVSGKTLDCCQISGTAFLYDQEYLVLDGYKGGAE